MCEMAYWRGEEDDGGYSQIAGRSPGSYRLLYR